MHGQTSIKPGRYNGKFAWRSAYITGQFFGTKTALDVECVEKFNAFFIFGTRSIGLKVRELIDQDRQCAYYVTLRRVRVTNVAVGKLWVLRIVSVCL